MGHGAAREVRKLDPAAWAGAAWGLVAVEHVRRQLARRSLDQVVVPPPPPLPDRARRGVSAMLRRRGATCLLQALVLQHWDAAHGQPRDLVIGVTPPSTGFRAHAWLDGDAPCHSDGFQEVLRRRVS